MYVHGNQLTQTTDDDDDDDGRHTLNLSYYLTSREGLRQVYDDMYKFLLVTNFGGR